MSHLSPISVSQSINSDTVKTAVSSTNGAAPNPVAAPAPELLERLREESARLESATPEEIVRWAVATYFPKLTMATAFGPEGCVIIYFLSRIEPRAHVFNLDTGYQFKETLALRDEIARRV